MTDPTINKASPGGGPRPAVVDAVSAIKAGRALLETKLAERDRLDQEIVALRLAFSGGAPVHGQRAARSAVKDLLLGVLAERGALGLNARTMVDLAAERGEKLRLGTVSSLLSRLKNDGLVTYDGRAYRIKEPPHASR